MSNPVDFETHRNGSINYTHYTNNGRTLRSQAAHSLTKVLWRWVLTRFAPAHSVNQIAANEGDDVQPVISRPVILIPSNIATAEKF